MELHGQRQERERERAAESICTLRGVRLTVYSILGGIGGLGVVPSLYLDSSSSGSDEGPWHPNPAGLDV